MIWDTFMCWRKEGYFFYFFKVSYAQTIITVCVFLFLLFLIESCTSLNGVGCRGRFLITWQNSFLTFSFRMPLSCFRYYRVSIRLWKLTAKLLGLILQKVPESEWLYCPYFKLLYLHTCAELLCWLYPKPVFSALRHNPPWLPRSGGRPLSFFSYSVFPPSWKNSCQKTSEQDKGTRGRWVENMCCANRFRIVQTYLEIILSRTACL